jgi:glycosyltransferase involved in cell wall biosynthesis
MTKNKVALYITFDGLSDPLGQSQILPYLAGIAKNGYTIFILSCEKADRLEKEKDKIHSLIKDLPITWQYVLYDENGGFLSRLLYIRKLTILAEKIKSSTKISLVHCRSYLASLIGLKFKLRYKIPFVFDMRGFWADERIDGGIWKHRNPLHELFYRYFKKKEKQFMTTSDAIVSLTNAGVTELDKKFPRENIIQKTTVIPCCTNTNSFNPDASKKEIAINGLSPQDHVLIYTGSIGTWYYTKEMIDCALVWRKHIPNLKLLIVTKDIEVLDVILSSYTDEQKSIIVKASASYTEIPSYLALAKAAIFFIKPSYSKIASSPTKMAECWAMNLPIITNQGIGDNDLYFNTHKGGILITNFSVSEYEKACEQYLKIAAAPINYREIALHYFDTQMAVDKYTAIYDSLV